ncbi:uncharacterized protein LOC141689117 [Apium graveolens]|uniref:uncharacterized protein LOC141689117 n=1 Tax=Apium graveolens TaxID=4045 RepID=UPI003D7984D2
MNALAPAKIHQTEQRSERERDRERGRGRGRERERDRELGIGIERAREREMTEEKTTVASMPEKVAGDADSLPKSIVRRLVKRNLSQLSKNSEISIFGEAIDALSETSRIFIHYLSAAANDICKESNRQTMSAEDVFKALEDIEFPEFVAPLRASLEEFRQKTTVKRLGASKAKEAKKSKKGEPTKSETEEKQNCDDRNEDYREASDNDSIEIIMVVDTIND